MNLGVSFQGIFLFKMFLLCIRILFLLNDFDFVSNVFSDTIQMIPFVRRDVFFRAFYIQHYLI